MKIQVIKVGKPAKSETATLAAEYLKRLKAFSPVEAIELKESQVESFLSKPASHTQLVLLDEKGKELPSTGFAEQIKQWSDDPSVKAITFVIGGPYGFSPEVLKLPHQKLCLSKMTLQGDLAWVLFCEQLYRAFTILKGMAYHHE